VLSQQTALNAGVTQVPALEPLLRDRRHEPRVVGGMAERSVSLGRPRGRHGVSSAEESQDRDIDHDARDFPSSTCGSDFVYTCERVMPMADLVHIGPLSDSACRDEKWIRTLTGDQ